MSLQKPKLIFTPSLAAFLFCGMLLASCKYDEMDKKMSKLEKPHPSGQLFCTDFSGNWEGECSFQILTPGNSHDPYVYAEDQYITMDDCSHMFFTHQFGDVEIGTVTTPGNYNQLLSWNEKEQKILNYKTYGGYYTHTGSFKIEGNTLINNEDNDDYHKQCSYKRH